MTDPRAKLRRGDDLLREERFAEAVDEYEEAASAYFDAGFALKGIAILKQVVDIVDRSAPELSERRTRALVRLADGYAALGLTSDAEAARRRLN